MGENNEHSHGGEYHTGGLASKDLMGPPSRQFIATNP
jgi:hypothetical protein